MIRYMKVVGFNLISKPLRHPGFLYSQQNSSFAQDSGFKVKDLLTSTEEFRLQRQKNLEKAFENVTTIPSLLMTAANAPKIQYALKAIDLLADWNKIKQIDHQEVINDKNFNTFVSIIEKNGIFISVDETIKALKNLKEIGFSSDSFLIESLQNDLMWNVRKVSVSSLLAILIFQRKNMETEMQKKVVEEALSAIETRWTEVRKPRDFLKIYSLSKNFSADFIKNIDELLSEKAADVNAHILADIILAISYSKRRPLPLLRSLSYQMFKQSYQLPPDKIKNVFLALDSLKFHDDALLGKLSNDFLNQIEEVKDSTIISTIAFCVGHMNWKDSAFLDALIKWVIDNINTCKPNDIVSLIISLAHLHHIPDKIEELIKVSISKLDFSSITKNKVVDIVWSLTVLGQVTNEQIAFVLEPLFASKFSIDDPFCFGSISKLLNINAAAKLIYTSYSGPRFHLNPEDLQKLFPTRSEEDLKLHNHVAKILHNFLPPKYVRENVISDFGYVVDAELIAEKNCRPIDITDYPSNLVEHENIKAIPEGAQRIAIMVWNYKDFNKNSLSLTGPNAFALQLLNKRGYKIVEIPYFEVSKNEKSLKTVQNIEKKIRDCIM